MWICYEGRARADGRSIRVIVADEDDGSATPSRADYRLALASNAISYTPFIISEGASTSQYHMYNIHTTYAVTRAHFP